MRPARTIPRISQQALRGHSILRSTTGGRRKLKSVLGGSREKVLILIESNSGTKISQTSVAPFLSTRKQFKHRQFYSDQSTTNRINDSDITDPCLLSIWMRLILSLAPNWNAKPSVKDGLIKVNVDLDTEARSRVSWILLHTCSYHVKYVITVRPQSSYPSSCIISMANGECNLRYEMPTMQARSVTRVLGAVNSLMSTPQYYGRYQY